MTYYEELGIPAAATPEQIHRAYRIACRLLHPDQHQDPDVARLAELQMQRLNENYRMLADPDRRRRYDLELASKSLTRRPLVSWRKWTGQACWYAGAIVAVTLISWYISGARIRTLPRQAARETVPDAISGAQLATRSPKYRRSAPAGAVTAPEPTADTVPQAATVAQPAIVDPEVEARAPSEQEPVEAPASVSPQRFHGTWFYAQPSRSKVQPAAHLYPPEFIEAVITESGSRVKGRYSARYRVPGKGISPNVSFRFEGTAEEERAVLTWSGKGGSKGAARITLLSENKMELRWSADELGDVLGLSEGQAVLVRAGQRF